MPVFFNKLAMAVSTTRGAGLDTTLNYLERTAILWGFNFVHKLGVAEAAKDPMGKTIDTAARKFYLAIKNNKRHAPSLNRLIEFRVLKVVFGKKGKPADYAFFKDKTVYYYNVKINVFKRLIACLIEKRMRRLMHAPSPY